jgi:AcrR family transcriptional regulator
MEQNSTKDQIISEAITLFMNYGVKSVTMDDIAKHLGISKKTIYQHFKDKEDIILQATEYYFQKEMEVMQSIEEKSENAVEHLYSLTTCLRERIGGTNHNTLYDLRKYYHKAWETYKRHKKDVIFNSVMKNFERGIAEGLFRENINPEILAYLRVGEIEMSFNKDFFPLEKYSIVQIHEQLFEHFTYGILSEKGLKLFETYKQKEV